METKRLLDLTLSEFLNMNYAAIMIAFPGAQGIPDSVLVVTKDKHVYDGKGDDNLFDIKAVSEKQNSFFGIKWRKRIERTSSFQDVKYCRDFQGRSIASPVEYFYYYIVDEKENEWTEIYLGGGNSLFLKNELLTAFYSELDRLCQEHNTKREDVFLYGVWQEVLMSIL